MTEIPEHLLKRAAAARDKATTPPDQPSAARSDAEKGVGSSRIPEHLLQRSSQARVDGRAPAGEAGGGMAVAERVTAIMTSDPPAGGVPIGAGPGGHTQRLLAVVKSGTIQDVKATPVDKVHTWPHLLAAEFVAALTCTAVVFVASIFVHAPLLELANANQTPNPSKAPWYFLGMQELLTYFHPMVGGITIPGVGVVALILTPYLDRNPSNKPEDRKFATSLQTVHLMFWAVLVIVGSFFRGPGFNFVIPWVDGLFFEL